MGLTNCRERKTLTRRWETDAKRRRLLLVLWAVSTRAELIFFFSVLNFSSVGFWQEGCISRLGRSELKHGGSYWTVYEIWSGLADYRPCLHWWFPSRQRKQPVSHARMLTDWRCSWEFRCVAVGESVRTDTFNQSGWLHMCEVITTRVKSVRRE